MKRFIINIKKSSLLVSNVLLEMIKSAKLKKSILGENVTFRSPTLKWSVYSIVILLLVNIHNKCKSCSEEWNSSEQEMKYVLRWTKKIRAPFDILEEGDLAFVRNECENTNCYVTEDKRYFFAVAEFDAIVFNGVDVEDINESSLPTTRSPKQKYIFGALESADRFPVCRKRFDGFFNWTWTYRLDSDFRWDYIAIYDSEGRVVGPAMDMKWISRMTKIDDELKLKLSNKTKAAAWFVSNCKTKRRRELLVRRLRHELMKLGLTVDTFGKCGSRRCPRTVDSECNEMLRDNYFFYFAFENSFGEDYVTEKLTRALNNYVVPVVFGGANYSRFVPDGAYLDARKLGPARLALEMNQIINNRTAYYDFFRWRNHYVYEKRGNKEVCKLCAMLNDDDKMTELTVWKDFRNWWNVKNACI